MAETTAKLTIPISMLVKGCRHPLAVDPRHTLAEAQLEAQLPSNAQDDDLALEVAALEQLVHALQALRHCYPPSVQRLQPTGGAICTRTTKKLLASGQ